MTTLHEELKIIHKRMQNRKNWGLGGICCLFFSGKNKFQFFELVWSWPEYSGHEWYPVPSKKLEAKDAYFECTGNVEDGCAYMWDRENSEYAAARWRLLEWAIEQTKPE